MKILKSSLTHVYPLNHIGLMITFEAKVFPLDYISMRFVLASGLEETDQPPVALCHPSSKLMPSLPALKEDPD